MANMLLSTDEMIEMFQGKVSNGLQSAINYQLSPHQFGFRKHHSTQDAVTFFADHVRKGIDLGSLTGAVFIDMRKAFDTVNHTLLLNKLNDLGINGKERAWFTSYLTDRRQLVM